MLELIVFWALLAILPAAIAYRKGQSFWVWAIYSVAIFPVALIHALLVKPGSTSAERFILGGTLTKCPFCAERVQPDAKVCRYCGRDLPSAASRRAPPPSRPLGPDALKDLKRPNITVERPGGPMPPPKDPKTWDITRDQ